MKRQDANLDVAGLVPLDGRALTKANGGWGPFFVPIPPHVLIEILRNRRQHGQPQGLRPGHAPPLIPRQGAY